MSKSDRLAFLATAAPTAELAVEFQAALNTWLAGDTSTLLEALGIQPGPDFKPKQRTALATRDDCLRRAAKLNCSGLCDAVWLSGECYRFDTRIWPRIKATRQLPDQATELDRLLLEAKKSATCRPLPGIDRCRQILKTENQE
jgi:hypothetical protein